MIIAIVVYNEFELSNIYIYFIFIVKWSIFKSKI